MKECMMAIRDVKGDKEFYNCEWYTGLRECDISGRKKDGARII